MGAVSARCFRLLLRQGRPRAPHAEAPPSRSPPLPAAAVAIFIRTKGVTRCPTACAAGLGLSIGASEWLFTPELKSGAVISVLQDWSLPAVDLWALFPAGRQASAKARAAPDDLVDKAATGL
jgi:DNA-binding transcriptional LysR family regulator